MLTKAERDADAAILAAATVRVVSHRSIVRHDVKTASGVHRITQRVDLDEIVIPGRVHVEDMGDGVWHVALGDGLLTFSVGPDGVVTVEDMRRRK